MTEDNCILSKKDEPVNYLKIESNVILYNNDQQANIRASVSSNSEIEEVLYQKGKVEIDEILKNGTKMTFENSFYMVYDLTENGYYTIYDKDKDGQIAISYVLVEGLIVLEGDFEDLYASGTFGKLENQFLDWQRPLEIQTKPGVKIVDARYDRGYFYSSITEFEENPSFGTKIDFTDDHLSFTAKGLWLQCVTIYVRYEYQEEIRPGVYENRTVSKLYKSKFSNYFN